MPKYKYYQKIQLGDKKWRYFYSREEWEAYLNGKTAEVSNKAKNFFNNLAESGRKVYSKISNSMKSTVSKVKNVTSLASKKTSSFMSKSLNDISSYISKGKDVFDKTIKTVGEKTHKYIAKVGEGTKARYFYTKEEYQAYINGGKQAVEKLMGKTNDLSSYVSKGLDAVANISKTTFEKANEFIVSGQDIALAALSGIGAVVVRKAANAFIDKILTPTTVTVNSPNEPPKYPSYDPEKHDQNTIQPKDPPKTGSKEEQLERTNDVENTIRNIEDGNLDLDLQIKDTGYTNDEDSAKINPNFNPEWDDMQIIPPDASQDYQDWAENCAACSIAYDLRSRGYDVEVMPESYYDNTAPTNVANIMATYPDADVMYYTRTESNTNIYDVIDVRPLKFEDREQTIRNLASDCEKQGEGARGIVLISYAIDENEVLNTGHAINYEIENGEMTFRDTQRDEKYTVDEYIKEQAGIIGRVAYIRTDDTQPSTMVYNYVHDIDDGTDYRRH